MVRSPSCLKFACEPWCSSHGCSFASRVGCEVVQAEQGNTTNPSPAFYGPGGFSDLQNICKDQGLP